MNAGQITLVLTVWDARPVTGMAALAGPMVAWPLVERFGRVPARLRPTPRHHRNATRHPFPAAVAAAGRGSP